MQFIRMISETKIPTQSECRERRGSWLFLEHSSIRNWKEKQDLEKDIKKEESSRWEVTWFPV